MKPKIYLETSVVSYLTARPSQDPIRAGLQQATRRWWATRSSFELYASEFVFDEAGAGHPEAADRRLLVLREAIFLEFKPEVIWLAGEILRGLHLPAKAEVDTLHVAMAAVHGLDYLLTWNCSHIANPVLRCKIEAVVMSAGFDPPYLCTPIELVEET